ncbi:MAG: hypothetical protein R2851_08240 [Caldilineaceae bacterium]
MPHRQAKSNRAGNVLLGIRQHELAATPKPRITTIDLKLGTAAATTHDRGTSVLHSLRTRILPLLPRRHCAEIKVGSG